MSLKSIKVQTTTEIILCKQLSISTNNLDIAMSFHHFTLTVPSLKEGREFYLAALAPLGYKEVRTVEGVVSALGPNGKPLFWIRQVKAENDQISKGVHLAFAAESRDVVDKFYNAAM